MGVRRYPRELRVYELHVAQMERANLALAAVSEQLFQVGNEIVDALEKSTDPKDDRTLLVTCF